MTVLVPNFLCIASEWAAARRELLIQFNVTRLLNAAFPQAGNHFAPPDHDHQQRSQEGLDGCCFYQYLSVCFSLPTSTDVPVEN